MTTFHSTGQQHRLGNAWLERLLRLAVAGALAGLMLALATSRGTAEITPTAPNVPAALQVPEGHTLRFRAYALGTQHYECQMTEAGTTVWTFRQPKAELVADDGEPLGIHGRGPFWAGYDGSRVVGSAPTSAPGIDPTNDIPLLLLRATSADQEGRFAGLSYIQRLDTRGGAAPAGPCDPDQKPTLAVPYLAVYYFYAPTG
jgi:hypothetical protein